MNGKQFTVLVKMMSWGVLMICRTIVIASPRRWSTKEREFAERDYSGSLLAVSNLIEAAKKQEHDK